MSHPDPLFDDYEDFHGHVDDLDVEDCYNDGWDDDDYDDSMDGDFDSAMGSAGWGVDEQYEHGYGYESDW